MNKCINCLYNSTLEYPNMRMCFITGVRIMSNSECSCGKFKLVNSKVMPKANHQLEVEKQGKIESDLLKLISDLGNEELQNKFLEWQRQRAICNVSLITELEHSITK